MNNNKRIEKLQYITQAVPGKTHIDMVQEAVDAGCKWVQLRMKETSSVRILESAIKAVGICKEAGVSIILNDFPHEALVAYTDGVHLGKEDMDPERARDLLGDDMIIGGTANTFEDIERLLKADVDYIGLGPFRFTETKKKLAPVLGHEGYRSLMIRYKMKFEEKMRVPIIAIGGIGLEDVDDILSTGVSGIAISGLISRSPRKTQLISELHRRIEEFPLKKRYGTTQDR